MIVHIGAPKIIMLHEFTILIPIHQMQGEQKQKLRQKLSCDVSLPHEVTESLMC